MGEFTDRLWSLLSLVYARLIFEPCRTLYLHSPAVGQFGGWHGFSVLQICGRLSSQSELFWAQHPEECEEMVDSRFRSFMLTAQTLLYFFLLYNVIRALGFLVSGMCLKTCALRATSSAPAPQIMYVSQLPQPLPLEVAPESQKFLRLRSTT